MDETKVATVVDNLVAMEEAGVERQPNITMKNNAPLVVAVTKEGTMMMLVKEGMEVREVEDMMIITRVAEVGTVPQAVGIDTKIVAEEDMEESRVVEGDTMARTAEVAMAAQEEATQVVEAMVEQAISTTKMKQSSRLESTAMMKMATCSLKPCLS
jgi:hypothetical protein